jgi:hypothetical protein
MSCYSAHQGAAEYLPIVEDPIHLSSMHQICKMKIMMILIIKASTLRLESIVLLQATSYHLPRAMPAFTQFYLPDPLAQWPWLRQLNPHYTEVKPESEAWLRSFETLDAKSQRSFDRCNFGEHRFL